MAAAGGGKIRNRRFHIVSKPYAKRTQQQTGIISRVTDTVKSIVPSWLQKYFKNDDEDDAAVGEEAVQRIDQNSQPPPPLPPPPLLSSPSTNCIEERSHPCDGRDSPEPSTSNTEPSTSQASLNCQDFVLSRPPLSRSHLHSIPPLDFSSSSSPALRASGILFSQPSTSSAPGPFSTAFSLVKEVKDNLSQHEDDNISTTSGFSSRASEKDVPTSKTASLPQLWSPEMDRTNSGPQPSHSSLKKPAFNLSVFGTSSNSTLKLGDSPFYPGKTMYGGAAAAKSSRRCPATPYQAPVRRQIKAKPAGGQPYGVTSATARRILLSLERMSSPLADAKRIAGAGSFPSSPLMDGSNLDVPHFQAKKKRMDSTPPPTQKLMCPTAASVSGNRSTPFRPTLTPGGASRSLDRNPRETPTRQSTQPPKATPDLSQSTMDCGFPAYPLSSTPAAAPASSISSGGGKMKRERTSARPSTKRPEMVELPDLPTVSLPINTSTLPTFSFSTPPPPATTRTLANDVAPAKETNKITNKEPPTTSASPSLPFTFSSPIVKATAASPPSFSPSAGFTFSAPVTKMAPSMSNGKLATPIAAAAATKSTEDFDGPFKPAKVLKQGSVLDLLKAPGFASPVAPPSDSSAQLTSTQSTSSSTTTTTSSSSSSSTGFDVFKAPLNWTCDVCLVPNKPSDAKCVCCMAPQPNSSSSKSTDTKPFSTSSAGLESTSSSSSSSSSSSTTTATGFGTMFSKAAGTWECDTCLVLNKPEAVKCVACETAKPGTGLKPSLTLPSPFSAAQTLAVPNAAAPVSAGFVGFGDKFKKPEGSWECDTCMVQNKGEDAKCVACMSAKPGASAAASVGSSSSSAPGFLLGDKFKKPEGDWDCDVCLLHNKSADVKCVACQAAKPGAGLEPNVGGSLGSSLSSSSTSTTGGFKFGTSDSSAGSGVGGFKFGGSFPESSSASSSSTGGFKFGLSAETASKDAAAASPGFQFGSASEGFKFGSVSGGEKKSEPPATDSGFKFGAGGGIKFGTGSSSTESGASKEGFTFGLSKPEEKTPDAITSSTSVSFTPRAKSDGAASSPHANAVATTTTTPTAAGSVFSRLGERSVPAAAPQGVSLFGSSQPDKEPAPPTFSFGKPGEKKEGAPSSSSTTSFLFAAVSKDADATPAAGAPSGFSFGKPSAPTEKPPPPYPFGKPADKSDAPEAPKPSFAFGQSATDSTPAPKPAFSFMASNPTNSAPSSTSAPPPSLFGSSSSTAQAPAPSAAPGTFMFSQPASSADAPPAKAFVFGHNQENQPPAPAPSQPFIFGGPPTAAPPAAAGSSFSFGGAAPPAASSSATSPFVFSSAPAGGFGANQPPSFGTSFGPASTTSFSAPPSQQPPAFGAKPEAAPVFGQQVNSTPVFGAAANSAPGGGFQFGGASAFGSQNTPVFNFGVGSPAPPAPPANPAMAPQSGPGFNFAHPPTFNLGTMKSFTASPAGQQAIAGRKIKTAVRRKK